MRYVSRRSKISNSANPRQNIMISHGFRWGMENGTNRFSETLIKLSYKIEEDPAKWSPIFHKDSVTLQ